MGFFFGGGGGDLFLEGVIIRGSFADCASKWVGLDNKNSVKHQLKVTELSKQLTLTVYGLTFERACCWKDICIGDFGGLIFGRGLLLEFYGITVCDWTKKNQYVF